MSFAPTSSEIPNLAFNLMRAKGAPLEARRFADSDIRTPPRVCAILKEAAEGGTLGQAGWSGVENFRNATTAFFTALRSQSIFFRFLDDGFRPGSLRQRYAASTMRVTGTGVSEGSPKPVSRLALSGGVLAPRKSAAVTVVSDSILEYGGPAAQNFVNSELRAGAVAGVDSEFLTEIASGAPSFVSSGDTGGAILGDLEKLLGVVNVTGGAALFFVADLSAANLLATAKTDDGGQAFPGTGPTGGELLNLPFLVSDQVPVDSSGGTLLLINAAAFSGAADALRLQASADTSLLMDTSPTSPAGMTSMFQTNSTALLAEITFGFEAIAANSVAILTGIAAAQES